MDPLLDVSGKIAIVTGGAGGIGGAVVEQLGAHGATCVIFDVTESANPNHIQVDLTDETAVVAAVAGVVEVHGRIDILVNAAGINVDAYLLKMSVEDFDKVINVNLRGTWLMMREVGKAMKATQNGGAMVNISSIGGDGSAGQSGYVATKSAIIGLTRGVAKELIGFGVRVNAIAPGATETDMTGDMKPAALEGLIQATPMGRMARSRGNCLHGSDAALAYIELHDRRDSIRLRRPQGLLRSANTDFCYSHYCELVPPSLRIEGWV